MTVDMDGFEKAMQAQRERARAASHFGSGTLLPADLVKSLTATEFLGYEALDVDELKVTAIIRDGQSVRQLASDEMGTVLLDRTPFYAESGGQVGDQGVVGTARGSLVVDDTRKLAGSFHGHVGCWHGEEPLVVGDTVSAQVDAERRLATVLNHTATHLLHAALRSVLGLHVTQKGSLVAPDRLRFDFSHDKPVSAEERHRIETLVNDEIRANHVGDIRQMSYDDAIEFGALALFGEKYGDQVRVLKLGDFSTELCGGTHVQRTGDIGLFKITGESGVASGVRRIEALTGSGALAHVANEEQRLAAVAELLSSNEDEVVDRLAQMFDRHKLVERELESMRGKAAGSAVAKLADAAREINGIKLVAARVDGLNAKALREGMDQLKQHLSDGVILLASGHDGKASLVAGVQGRALEKIKAGDVVAHVASQINGKGGGRADMAQGGGEDSPALDIAIDGLAQWVEKKLD